MPPDAQGQPDPTHHSMRVARIRTAIDEQDDIQRDALLRMFLSAAWLESRVFEQ
jgi:hypothetical protein